jgi:hypothetical protein
MAFATVFKFTLALKVGGETALVNETEDSTVDESTAAGKALGAAMKRNALAMANLTMAFTNETTMGLVWKAMNDDWPGGLAHLVVAALFKKYQPQDTITRVELRQMLADVSMQAGEDPATLFEQVSSIENRYNTATRKIEEEDLIAVVLSAASEEYQAVLTIEQRIRGGNVTLEDLEACMNQYWRQTKSSDHKKDSEIALVAFGGKCFNCGKHGHKSYECPESKKEEKKCFNCGKPGHIEVNCWLKEENKDKRPTYWKGTSESEQAAVAHDQGSRCEFLL